ALPLGVEPQPRPDHQGGGGQRGGDPEGRTTRPARPDRGSQDGGRGRHTSRLRMAPEIWSTKNTTMRNMATMPHTSSHRPWLRKKSSRSPTPPAPTSPSTAEPRRFSSKLYSTKLA